MDTLARESGLTGRHVRRLLPGLESDGWIQIERATGSRQSRHTIFVAPREGWCRSSRCMRSDIPVHAVGHFRRKSRRLPLWFEGLKRKILLFAPIEQNCNLPAPPAPDDDPAATAAAWALGPRHFVELARIAAEGGAP